MFSVCLSVHTWGGGTYLPDGGGGGTYSQVWMVGGVPTFAGPGGGGTYSQAWMGGVPTFPGPGGGGKYLLGWGGVPTQDWMGGYLPR